MRTLLYYLVNICFQTVFFHKRCYPVSNVAAAKHNDNRINGHYHDTSLIENEPDTKVNDITNQWIVRVVFGFTHTNKYSVRYLWISVRCTEAKIPPAFSTPSTVSKRHWCHRCFKWFFLLKCTLFEQCHHYPTKLYVRYLFSRTFLVLTLLLDIILL